MLLSCHINLVKLENFWLSKILGITYNLERREYMASYNIAFFPKQVGVGSIWLLVVSKSKLG